MSVGVEVCAVSWAFSHVLDCCVVIMESVLYVVDAWCSECVLFPSDRTLLWTPPVSGTDA